MLDLGILFKSKYYEELGMEHHLYHDIMTKYVNEKLDAMNGYEKLRYSLFKRAKGLKFGSVYSGVSYTRAAPAKSNIYPKISYIWGDLSDLYFNLP